MLQKQAFHLDLARSLFLFVSLHASLSVASVHAHLLALILADVPVIIAVAVEALLRLSPILLN